MHGIVKQQDSDPGHYKAFMGLFEVCPHRAPLEKSLLVLPVNILVPPLRE